MTVSLRRPLRGNRLPVGSHPPRGALRSGLAPDSRAVTLASASVIGKLVCVCLCACSSHISKQTKFVTHRYDWSEDRGTQEQEVMS